MGDGVLVYFGYPQARENATEQAVRAGLALVDTVRRLQQPEPLRVRIGIATGQVAVSVRAWSFVVSPPRERPSPWSSGSLIAEFL